MSTLSSPNNFYQRAIGFEITLAIFAVVIGWLAGINPFKNIQYSELGIMYGLLGTIPLILMFLGLQRLQTNSVSSIRQLLTKTLGPHLSGYGWTDLLLLGAVAGISEELLFRGLLQPWIEMSWGYTVGIMVSNVIFGLAHAVTPLYAGLAAIVGIYLGLSMDYGVDRNLLTPILIHSLYDFLAFLMLMRAYRASLATMPDA